MAKKAKKPAGSRTPPKPGKEKPEKDLRKGDRVRVHMRADWEIVGEVRAVTKEGLRVFDFIIEDVLHVRRHEIARIDSLKS